MSGSRLHGRPPLPACLLACLLACMLTPCLHAYHLNLPACLPLNPCLHAYLPRNFCRCSPGCCSRKAAAPRASVRASMSSPAAYVGHQGIGACMMRLLGHPSGIPPPSVRQTLDMYRAGTGGRGGRVGWPLLKDEGIIISMRHPRACVEGQQPHHRADQCELPVMLDMARIQACGEGAGHGMLDG